ncbi:MAG: tRNA uridine-5-carboxymethylaminomethyl(34) synthesis GTPase MnmE [Haliscomenobacter sp.]|nr:tRNA uridine-5-carboxymethylaminomethyl(34) synthesis GTPase MnmE [Haliscomenobacter sp.]
MNLSDTIIALATPPGVGAIGVIRLSGEDAIVLADRFFHGKPLNEQPSHTIHFGTIRDETGRIVDEVLVSLFIAPRSYTGENVVEISCHGSNYILEEVIRLFLRAGARQAQPGEFTLRAFLNGRMDLSQAEAVADLIASASSEAHKLAIAQLRGGVSDEIKRLRQELLDFASLIELELDFSEEDVEFADRTQLHHLIDRIQTLIKALLDSFQLGNAIRQGVSTVIAGRPNAGKSTLLNALLNEERAIVSEIAGTTRDTIEELLNIQGIQFRIIDTAGIREAHDTIEALGVERTLEKVRQSAVLVYVFDVVKTSPEQVRYDLDQLIHSDLKVLVVANKMDLNPYTQFEHYFEGAGIRERGLGEQGAQSSPLDPLNVSATQWVPISAINRMNIEYLKEKLFETVIQEELSMDTAILSNTRHYEALQKAGESLQAVKQNLQTGVATDFIAMDIRRALHFLGEITGEISTDDLLGNIFSRFCIGK